MMHKRKSHTVLVRTVSIGGENPPRVQSMTNTLTADIDATVKQIHDLSRSGSELVRITVNDTDAARAVPEIRRQIGNIPLIGDFHYNGHILLTQQPLCAEALDKIRINPGNVGAKKQNLKDNFHSILDIAKHYQKPIRIGVNWGSLDEQILTEKMEQNALLPKPLPAEEVQLSAVVESALRSADLAIAYGIQPNNIVLSAKTSDPQTLICVYRELAKSPFALHLGLTEAGMGYRGIVKSIAGLAPLLTEGIGDTIRISLTPEPQGDRTLEVKVAYELLQSLGIRSFMPSVTSCPGCGRTTNTAFQQLTIETEHYLRRKLPEWKTQGKTGVENLHFAVMGCIVNGPGESRKANLGISLPGNNENPRCPVYANGIHITTLQTKDFQTLKEQWLALIEKYVQENSAVH